MKGKLIINPFVKAIVQTLTLIITFAVTIYSVHNDELIYLLIIPAWCILTYTIMKKLNLIKYGEVRDESEA